MNPEIKDRIEKIRNGIVPEDYKKTKIGIIPEEWAIKKLGQFVIIQSGESPSKFKFVKNGVPYYKVDSLNNSSKYQCYSDYYISKSEKYLVKKGSLIFPKRGAAIFLNKVRILSKDSFMDTNLMTLTTKLSLDNEFLYYYIIKEKLYKITDTSTIPQLNNKHINPHKIVLPTLPEQSRIATILSTWDKTIELKEKLIEQKKLQKKGLMQLLLTGKKRVINPETGKPFEGEWEEVKLGEICEINKGIQLNKSIMIVNGKYLVINGGIEPSGFTNEWNTKGKTITISEGGNSCGFVNFIEHKFWSGGHCYTLLNLQVNKNYLFQILKFKEKTIMRLRVGSGLPNIQKKDIEKHKIILPKKEEQNLITFTLSTADKEIELLKKELAQLKEQKRGLMQLLLTGIVRVTEGEYDV